MCKWQAKTLLEILILVTVRGDDKAVNHDMVRRWVLGTERRRVVVDVFRFERVKQEARYQIDEQHIMHPTETAEETLFMMPSASFSHKALTTVIVDIEVLR
ncbi:hypothetical protein llap_2742 [Limosa lapponica baueri]|uniref:Uncharacterized protein n=1 Tax=Limosa lapponica baueri TaxID=1758121 RepID=A0A2I0ULP3_LIMLA|nr:hypothetical protein llap_2742 [Limosa lapponica baueri]